MLGGEGGKRKGLGGRRGGAHGKIWGKDKKRDAILLHNSTSEATRVADRPALSRVVGRQRRELIKRRAYKLVCVYVLCTHLSTKRLIFAC